jgi:hypothetical protein
MRDAMSEVRLVVREAGQDWSGTIHGSCAERAIAALSADSVTLAELESACARFAKPTPGRPFFANLSPGFCDQPYDAGIVIIDLVAQLVVVDSTYSSPGPTGEIGYHNGECATDTWLPYHLAEDWLLTSNRCQWPALAERRRRERAARPHRDAREVFYGRPLLEFVARESFAAFARRMTVGEPPKEENPGSSRRRTDEEITYDMLKEIHAAWLLTPREDLDGACPRDVALERHNHLTWDLQESSWGRRNPPRADRKRSRSEILLAAKFLVSKASATNGSRRPIRNVTDERRDPSSTASAPGFPKLRPATRRWWMPIVPVARC